MKNMWVLSHKNNSSMKEYLARGFSRIMTDVLYQRGYTNVTDMVEYLRPSLFNLYSPYLFKDMEKIIERLVTAHTNQEKILIYGDYDADGVTGTALLYKVLTRFGFNVLVHIPSREEGYGLHTEIIEKAVNNKVQLIVTVDCGITAVKETALAAAKGIDIIITDHHEPPSELPAAIGILNPKIKDSGYPFESLAGVGVAYKLVQALFDRLRHLQGGLASESDYLDLAALGTIADIVPLTDENRIIVRYGLEKMENSIHTGLKALLEECGLLGKKLKSGQISYIVAPRINAAGRMDTAQMALNLLLEEDYEDARCITKDLSRENYLRQTVEKDIVTEIQSLLDVGDIPKVIVLSSPHWHHGVIGIVASRLVERYQRPVFLIAEDGETGKGSARGIEGYNVIEELDKQALLLDKYGGHKQAAGFSLAVKDINSLREALNQSIEEEDLHLTERHNVDTEVNWKELNLELLKELEQMAPFGAANPAPLLMTRGLKINKVFTVGKEGDHLKMILEDSKKAMEALAFKKGDEIEQLKNIPNLDIIYYLESNSFSGEEKLQAVIKDYRASDETSLYEIACTVETACTDENNLEEKNCTASYFYPEDNPVLSREILVDFYKKLKETAQDREYFYWETTDDKRFMEIDALKVFEELDLITWLGGTGPFCLKLNKINRTDLNNSLRYKLFSIT